MIARALALALICATSAGAQALTSGETALLRGLDRVSGAVQDLELPVGGTVEFGRLRIHATACRFPADNPEGEGFAFLEITDTQGNARLFQGWMIASSPALNALDHARYDIWVLGCR